MKPAQAAHSASSKPSGLFGNDFMTKLEYLSLVSRRTFRGQLLAQRRSKKLGSGVEFADHRDYHPGDDFRHLDWNLFARHNELLLRRFQEEEDLHVYLMLDCSKSMGFGSPAKFDLARQVTAALAYIALADLDRASIVAFGDHVVSEFPLTRGKTRILSILRYLERLSPLASETNLGQAVADFSHGTRRSGVVVIVSDLFDPRGYEKSIELLRHHQHDVHVVHLFDRAEAEPNFLGDVEFWDIENDSRRQVVIDERRLRRYREIFQKFLAGVEGYCRRYAIGYTRSTSDIPFDAMLMSMMRSAGPLSGR